MKASELVAEGFYWCSHDLAYCIPAGSRYPVRLTIMEFVDRELWGCAWEDSAAIGEIPDYVNFTGPLEPPA